jgi:hypothetical protein
VISWDRTKEIFLTLEDFHLAVEPANPPIQQIVSMLSNLGSPSPAQWLIIASVFVRVQQGLSFSNLPVKSVQPSPALNLTLSSASLPTYLFRKVSIQLGSGNVPPI